MTPEPNNVRTVRTGGDASGSKAHIYRLQKFQTALIVSSLADASLTIFPLCEMNWVTDCLSAVLTTLSGVVISGKLTIFGVWSPDGQKLSIGV